MIHTSDHRPLKVSIKSLQLSPGSSLGFTRRARSWSLMGWGEMEWGGIGVGGWDGRSNGSNFLYTF